MRYRFSFHIRCLSNIEPKRKKNKMQNFYYLIAYQNSNFVNKDEWKLNLTPKKNRKITLYITIIRKRMGVR